MLGLFSQCVRLQVLLAAIALTVAVMPRPAAAQTIINQTSCTSGANCLTNGTLQTISVDCSAGQTINGALAQIADRNGPNVVNVSGTCNVGTNIVGFNRLVIQGNPATITRGSNIVNSRNITLRSLTFDFAASPGNNLALNASGVILDGITIENTQFVAGVVVAGASNLGFTGAPSLITGNGSVGLEIGAGSNANVVNVTVSNNGFGQGVGGHNDGIHAHNGGSLNLGNQIQVNGVVVDAPVDISGNKGDGIKVEGGTVTSSADVGSALIHIHDNGGTGLELNGANAELDGHFKLDGNLPTPESSFRQRSHAGSGSIREHSGDRRRCPGRGWPWRCIQLDAHGRRRRRDDDHRRPVLQFRIERHRRWTKLNRCDVL